MAIESVRIRGLGKRYGIQRALASVDLELKAGGLCALLGPNGAGKSTLLGIISSVVRATSGTVEFLSEGMPIAQGHRLRREIGVLSHNSFLYSGLNALENLMFWAQLYNVENAEERCCELLDFVRLERAAWCRSASTYSRGMIQRLALARTLLHKPSVLLLDEPFTGLDRAGTAALTQALVDAVHRACVVLVITHDMETIADVTTHVAVLKSGQLVHESMSAGFSARELKDIIRDQSE